MNFASLYRKLRYTASVVPAIALVGGVIGYFVDNEIKRYAQRIDRSLEIHRKISEPFFSERFSYLLIYREDFDKELESIQNKKLNSHEEIRNEVRNSLAKHMKNIYPGKNYTQEEAFLNILLLMDNARECVKQGICDKNTAVNLLGPLSQRLYDPYMFYIGWSDSNIPNNNLGSGYFYFRDIWKKKNSS